MDSDGLEIAHFSKWLHLLYRSPNHSFHIPLSPSLAAASCLGVAMAKTEVPSYRTTTGPNSVVSSSFPIQCSMLDVRPARNALKLVRGKSNNCDS